MAKEERLLEEEGKTMDRAGRKKYEDMLHDLEIKKGELEERRKEINNNEKVWQRECRELRKMQFWQPRNPWGWGGQTLEQDGAKGGGDGGNKKGAAAAAAAAAVVVEPTPEAQAAEAQAAAEAAMASLAKADEKKVDEAEDADGKEKSKKRKASPSQPSRGGRSLPLSRDAIRQKTSEPVEDSIETAEV